MPTYEANSAAAPTLDTGVGGAHLVSYGRCVRPADGEEPARIVGLLHHGGSCDAVVRDLDGEIPWKAIAEVGPEGSIVARVELHVIDRTRVSEVELNPLFREFGRRRRS